MWSAARYREFLARSQAGEITEEWFRWFVGAWSVARTIRDGCQESVREYLDRDFRMALANRGGSVAVDGAAAHIQRQRWSSQTRKDGLSSLPLSLVAKVGFFLCPSELVPLDRYAVQGLNELRRAIGSPRLSGRCYVEYLAAFDSLYAEVEPQLAAALQELWVYGLASKVGCPEQVLKTVPVRRKLLDNYLMHLAEYQL